MEEKPCHPVDRGWGWMVVLGCSLSIFLMGGVLRTFGILLEEISEYFEIPTSVGILIITLESVGYTLASSVGVLLGEKFSARAVVITAGLIGSIGIALSSLLINITFLICTIGICLGVGNGLMHGNGLVMVSRYFEKRRALATGLAVAGGSIGQFVMPPILHHLLSTYFLSGTLLIVGGIYLHMVVSGCLYRPVSFYNYRKKRSNVDRAETGDATGDTELKLLAKSDCGLEMDASTKDTGHQPEFVNKHLERLRVPGMGESQGSLSMYASMEDIVSASMVSLSHVDDHQEGTVHTTVKQSCSLKCAKCSSVLKTLFDISLLKNLPFLYFTLAILLNFMGFFNVIFFIPSHAMARKYTRYQAAFLVSINGLLDLVGRVGCGWFADLKLVKRYKILTAVMMVSGLNCILLPFATQYWWLGINCGIYGATSGAFLPLLPVMTVDLFGLELLPKALAILLFLMGAVVGIGQPLLGLMADYTGSLDIVFYVSGGVCLTGALLTPFLPVVVKVNQRRDVVVNGLSDSDQDIVISPETKGEHIN